MFNQKKNISHSNNTCPNRLKMLFKHNDGPYAMRNALKLILSKIKSNSSKFFITYYGPKCWNYLANSLKQSKTQNIFNNKFKKIYISMRRCNRIVSSSLH